MRVEHRSDVGTDAYDVHEGDLTIQVTINNGSIEVWAILDSEGDQIFLIGTAPMHCWNTDWSDRVIEAANAARNT